MAKCYNTLDAVLKNFTLYINRESDISLNKENVTNYPFIE